MNVPTWPSRFDILHRNGSQRSNEYRGKRKVFSVIFEVHPKRGQWDAYLDNAKMLRPELMKVARFVDNIRYKSLTREGWILSLVGVTRRP